MGTAAGRMCPPGVADPESPIPGTESGALAETETLAAAEPWVSTWGEPARTCFELPGCHGWTCHLGAPPCLSSHSVPGLSLLPVRWLGQRFVLQPWRVSSGEGWEQQDAPFPKSWGSVPLLH